MAKDDEKMLSTTQDQVSGIVIGVITALNASGEVLVAFGSNPNQLPIAAKSTTPISVDDIGRQAALLFENGDVRLPIIMGLIQNPLTPDEQTEKTVASKPASIEALSDDVKSDENFGDLIVDGKKITLNAKEQITLKCGKSSITMTSAGKIIVRGTYLSNKSSGVNRIHGGSVQIN